MRNFLYFIGTCAITAALAVYVAGRWLFDLASLHISHRGNAKSKERADWKSRP